MLRPAALLIAALLLVGCMPVEPTVTPVPEPSATPIFASDEDALAAATEAYAKYLEAVDQSLTTFGVNALHESSEGKALAAAMSKAKEYEAAGKHQTGQSKLNSTQSTDLEAVLHFSEDMAEIQIYGCVDISQVDIRDAEDSSIVSVDRPDLLLYLVTLAWHSVDEEFMITDQELWEYDC